METIHDRFKLSIYCQSLKSIHMQIKYKPIDFTIKEIYGSGYGNKNENKDGNGYGIGFGDGFGGGFGNGNGYGNGDGYGDG